MRFGALLHVTDEWILFARRAHPIIYEAIMDAAQREGIAPKQAHDIHTVEQAVTWYLNTLAWPFSQNPPLALAPKV
jgi:hypothetical protein